MENNKTENSDNVRTVSIKEIYEGFYNMVFSMRCDSINRGVRTGWEQCRTEVLTKINNVIENEDFWDYVVEGRKTDKKNIFENL